MDLLSSFNIKKAQGGWMNNNYTPNRSWAVINLDNIAQNTAILRDNLNRTVEIMAVVKADAYGHGAEKTIPVLLRNGVTRLAVSMLDEAIELRKRGIDVPILVLGYTNPRRAEEIIEYDITQTVYTMELAIALSKAAVKLGCEVRVHIKIDTGMLRVGFMAGYDSIKQIHKIGNLPKIVIEGIYTHFSTADEEDRTYTENQFEKFMSVVNELGRLGIQIPIKHACNSAAILKYPHMHLDMVRPGILLYGISPSKNIDISKLGYTPSMTLKTNVVQTKEIEKGQSVSYGRTFTANRKSTIATIPIGYADGYLRSLSNKAEVLINDQRFPIAGTICMDTCMVDITSSEKEIKIGDEAVLFGKMGDNYIPIQEIASLMNTISYEVVCLIGRRVPRVYIENNEVLDVRNYLLD